MKEPKINNLDAFFKNVANFKPLVHECLIAINKPLLHLKEVGVTSKQVTDWRKAGIFNDDFENRKWREFTIVEAIWLKFVRELRFFGMPYDVIEQVKDYFFKLTVKEFKSQLAMLETLPIKPDGLLEFIYKQKQRVPAEIMQHNKLEIDRSGINKFIVLIIIVILTENNFSFYFDEVSFSLLSTFDPVTNEQKDSIESLYKGMSKKSFTLINFGKLISEFFDNNELDNIDDIYLGLLNNAERELIEKIKSGVYNQVTVKIEEGNIIQFRLMKKDDKLAIRKISRFFKKGDYKEIQLTTRNGDVVSYNETDIIKLNKK